MSRKIMRSTPNRKNLFGREMKSSWNYVFIRLTDVILRNEYRELSAAFVVVVLLCSSH